MCVFHFFKKRTSCVYGCLNQMRPDADQMLVNKQTRGNEDHPKMGFNLLMDHLFLFLSVLWAVHIGYGKGRC
jgi:hypothetical protein